MAELIPDPLKHRGELRRRLEEILAFVQDQEQRASLQGRLLDGERERGAPIRRRGGNRRPTERHQVGPEAEEQVLRG